MDSESIFIYGTINAKPQAKSNNIRRPSYEEKAVHILNRKTRFNIICDESNRYKSSWKLTKSQLENLLKTKNLM